MKRTSFSDIPCSIARTLDVIGEWWTPLILRDVFNGIRRFDGLLEHLGISRNVLTDRLQSLVENGILERRPYQQNPERHEYWPTEKGMELLPILLSLMSWGDKWLAGEEGVPVEAIHRTCGHVLTPKIVCSECGEAVTTKSIKLRLGPALAGKTDNVLKATAKPRTKKIKETTSPSTKTFRP